jgi:PASTA domain
VQNGRDTELRRVRRLYLLAADDEDDPLARRSRGHHEQRVHLLPPGASVRVCQVDLGGFARSRVDAFLDLESLDEAGAFDVKVLNQIAGRPYLVIVLAEGTLDRCRDDGDWLWRELEHAMAQRRIIVPAIIPPFDFADAERFLPTATAAATLRSSQGVSFPPQYFDDAVERLADRLRPVDLQIRPLTADDHEFARRAAAQAERLVEVHATRPTVPSPDVGLPPEADWKAKRRSGWSHLVAAVAAAFLLVVLGIVAWRAFASDNSPATPRLKVQVPPVAGLEEMLARTILEAEPYRLDVAVSTQPSTDVAIGKVVRTDPVEGTRIPHGDPIELVASSGAPTVTRSQRPRGHGGGGPRDGRGGRIQAGGRVQAGVAW